MSIEELKKNLIKKYSELSLDDKRDEFNHEIIAISMLINTLLNIVGKNSASLPNNYKKIEDIRKSEDEFLVDNYEGIIDLKDKLMLLVDIIKK